MSDDPVMHDFACRDGFSMRPVPYGQTRQALFCGQCQYGPRLGTKCLFGSQRWYAPWMEADRHICAVCGNLISRGAALCKAHAGERTRLADYKRKGRKIDEKRLAHLNSCAK